MAVKTPDTKEEQDSAYNPGDIHAAEQFGAYSDAGVDQAEAFANDPTNASKETKTSEENPKDPNSINFTGSGSAAGGPQGRFSFSRKGLKKKAPATALVGGLVGGFAGIATLFTPALAVVQIKEIMNKDLNDQLAAMDIRSFDVIKAKVKGMGKSGSLCTGVKVRCGFKGMSGKQIEKFARADIEVKTTGSPNAFNKYKVKSMIFTDSRGIKHEVTNVRTLDRMIRNDITVHRKFRQGLTPKFSGFFDEKFHNVMKRFKTSKTDKIRGASEEEKDKNMREMVKSGQSGTLGYDDKRTGSTEAEQTTYDEEVSRLEERANGGGGVRSVFGSAVRGVGVLGALDSACMIKNLARAVESGAKLIRAAQLARFAMVFMTFADQVKAGDATAEDATYVGNKLTAIDTRKEIITDDSPIENDIPQKIDNPDFGKNAFDSSGYKVAAYNDAPTLSTRSMQYTVGGAKMGKLSKLNSLLSVSDGTCDIVTNPFVQGAGLLAGVILSFGTGGGWLAVSVGTSLAIVAAMPILEAYLKDMLAGNVITKFTKGVEAGDAMFSGSAVLQGTTASFRGLHPAQDVGGLESYQKLASEVKSEYIAMETQAAQETPFDVMNQYSFLGSFARKLMPTMSTATTSVGATVSALPSFLSIAANSVTPSANAIGEFNPERFSKCKDTGYDKIGIKAADVFCNVRFIMTDEELALDTDEVIDYMHGQESCWRPGVDPPWIPVDCVDSEGNPQWQYEMWLDECAERPVGWGEEYPAESGRYGEACLGEGTYNAPDGSPPTPLLSHFRVFTMDQSIIHAMEFEPPTQSSSGSLSEDASSFVVASYNILHADSHTEKSREIGGCNTNPVPSDPKCMKTRGDRQVKIITGKTGNPAFDLFGTQETSPGQFAYLKNSLDNYAAFPNNSSRMHNRLDGAVAIFWNTDKFRKIDSGKAPGISNTSRAITNPWVGLETASGHKVYAMSIHYAITAFGGTDASIKKSSRLTMDWVKSKVGPDTTVIVMGDFNDRPHQKLSYCVFTQNGVMQHVSDMAKGKNPNAGCNNPTFSGIDHIYVTPNGGVKASKWIRMANTGIVKQASDHVPVYATITLPGSGGNERGGGGGGSWNGNASAQGFQWPTNRGSITNCWRKPGHTGIDIGVPVGTPVYALKAGVVAQAKAGGDSGNYVMIKHENGLWTNYQHNSQLLVSAGDEVSQGQMIAKSGNTGYSTGPHIHFGVTNAATLSSRSTGTNSLNIANFLPPKPSGIGGGTCS